VLDLKFLRMKNDEGPTNHNVTLGYVLGGLGVFIFALTLPMTRLAVGDNEHPQLSPFFVTAGRAAVAGLLSAAYLLVRRCSVPPRALWRTLGLSAAGTVIGFPLGIAMALREVPSMHAAVVTGLLPLATAIGGAITTKKRHSLGFWFCAILGCVLVIAFAHHQGGGRLVGADGWLLFSIISAAIGYVAGARASAQLPSPQVISWVLVGSLPLTLPLMLLAWPQGRIEAAAWIGFGYVAVFSMWIGFFAWYRGLVLGGVVRVSQVQLLQPFLALLLAAPILGERLDPLTLGFSLVILVVVAVGRWLP
jgi:drug/metabolite transporter (DMT)-like permease